ncbi:TIGR03943 family protein [Bacillus methanolicus]|uniref:TIGR03943 family putative permease subunit n=1 Tax=Bacillus methanolicus TaxID=1471 RepID=UPI00238041AA|nr:TIGR03943 family protein [Bacillus methanolicus]MDE3838887.1 TIGR03943 family protein [Bacillus methanolicus]
MQFHVQQAIRAFILFTFSALILKLHFTGDMTKFINPKYENLSQAAAVIFLLLFMVQLTRVWTLTKEEHHCHDGHECSHHDHGDSPFSFKKAISYFIIVFPLLTGIFLPAKALDASIANKKGAMISLSNQAKNGGQIDEESASNGNPSEPNTDNSLEKGTSSTNTHDSNVPVNPNEMTEEEYQKLMKELENAPVILMKDLVYSSYYDAISIDVDKYKGRKIQLNGFVYKEKGFQPNQLVISRFLITHCVADAGIIGFLSEFPEASTLYPDTWIEAEGTLDVTTYNGTKLPLIKINSWKKIDEPKEPYLYPISVKLK